VRKSIRSVVAKLPNIQKLKPEQDQCLLSVVGGHDVVALLLTTGFGKSLIFQLTPLVVNELAKANDRDAKPIVVVVSSCCTNGGPSEGGRKVRSSCWAARRAR
jgi:superfamily II DNA helicase RecQ